jgi:diguanylate cyclase (GGDEF)-like protein/PAS domain S-box-containing protein
VVARSTNGDALVASLPDVVFVIDVAATLRFVSPAAQVVLGWDPNEWLGRSVVDLLHPDDVALAFSSLSEIQGKELGSPIELRVRNATGGWQWLEVIGADHVERPGVDGIVCVARDLTRRRMWEVARGDVATFQQVVQHAASITLLLDREGLVRSVNGAFTRLLLHDPAQIVGESLESFADAASAERLAEARRRCLATHESVCVEVLMRVAGPGAHTRPVRFELVNLVDDPVVKGLIVTGHDMTELAEARQALERLANRDALTGLANRSVMLDRLQEMVDEARPVAVVFVDLDRFKPVNDLLGHDAGDELLNLVGERLAACVRSTDLVCRFGGDEFVVVAPGLSDRAAARSLARQIEHTLQEPFALRAGMATIGASVGVALADRTSTVNGLLADADAAMYDAKAAKRGRADGRAGDRRRGRDQGQQLADELGAGLTRGEVVAYLQPIVAVGTGETIAVEALARWHHPVLGVLSPAAFMDVAEYTGLDLPLGDAVLQSACSTLGLVRTEAPDIPLCVNLSVGQLYDPALVSRFSRILDDHRLRPERLTVEVTEAATLSAPPRPGRVAPEATLLALRALGARLCLDDFGTGRSSLSDLRRFPLASLKIDRSFVARMLSHQQDRAVISALVALAEALELTVVAEGVESREQLHALRQIGCHAAQGFFTAVPLSPGDAVTWLREASAAGHRLTVAAARGASGIDPALDATAA